MKSDFIVDVSEADFEYQVLAYSQQIPVVVDFWAEWCIPCKILGPILEKLAEEAQGEFRLAKVNVDQNPNLSRQLNIHGIPAVKAFREGHVVGEFTGALPEPRIREFLRTLIPSPLDLSIEKGGALLQALKPAEAEAAFRVALQEEPQNPRALLGLTKSLLLQGKGVPAGEILRAFPHSTELKSAETLRPLATGLQRLEKGEYSQLSDNPVDAAFERALRLIKRGNIFAALDGLLDVLRQNKRYRNGEARFIIVALLELLGDENPETREYRNELASILF